MNRALTDAIQQPIWTVRADGTVAFANTYWQEYTGLRGEAALGEGWVAAVHPDDIGPIERRWKQARADGAPYELEYRFRRADGIYRWHLARVAPIAAAGDAEEQWTGTAIDIHDRRRAEDALRASEDRFRDVVDQVNDIIYTIALDGEILAMNQAVETILGYQPEEVIGRSIAMLIVPEHVEVSRSNLEAKLSGQRQSAYEIDGLHKEGHRVRLEINSRLVPAEGKPAVINGIARDVAVRQERTRQVELAAAIGAALTARQPLVEQLQRCTEEIVRHLGVATARIWTIEDADEALLVLRAGAGMPTGLDGPHGRIPLGIDTIGRIAATCRPHVSNAVVGDPEVSDQEWARREGMVAFAGFPLHIGDRVLGVLALFARAPIGETTLAVLGSIVDAVAVGIDRDQAERARESLLKRERTARRWAEAAEVRYRGLFEGVADAILVLNADRRCQDANAAATSLLGYDYAELLTLRVEDVIVGDPDWTRSDFDEAARDGHWQALLELRRKDGTTMPVEARATVVDLQEGPVFIAAIRDISERARLERLQRDFLAMVTHDLRSPLTSIKGRSQLLRRQARDEERTQRAVASILDQVGRMERLIDDLADVVRLEAGELRMHLETTDLVDVAREQLDLMREQTQQHTFRLDADGPARGEWDRHRIGQVLQNLLTNAVKYSPNGGEIVIRVDQNGSLARLVVTDQGVGIPEDQLPRLFERFYRADATGAGGLGLGLYITDMLVRALGGKITAVSQYGEGSAFTVTLPKRQRGAGVPP